MDVELVVDDENVPLNVFATKVFGGMLTGAISSLRGIPEDWKVITLKVKKNG